MEKLYNRINFENAPSKKTPLSEENLNKMDSAINEIDSRVIGLKGDLSKLETDFDNEVTNRQSAIANEQTARVQAITAEKNRAVKRENEIEALFSLPTQEAVNKWLDEHPEATTTVQDNSLTLDKFVIGAMGYFSPQMYGAIGDGVADDTNAIQSMINDIESTIEKITMSNYEYYDFTKVSFAFDGQYKITKPIKFTKPFGLRLNGLNLIAGEGFVGDALLIFDTLQRKCIMADCQFDGAFNVNYCLFFKAHFVAWEVSNVQIKRFVINGLRIDTEGNHSFEFMGNNIRILQREDTDSIPSGVNTGTGLYIAPGSSDNNFVNLVISGCYEKSFDANGSSTYFDSCHFYGKDSIAQNVAVGNNNIFNSCYFDYQTLELDARCSVVACYFKCESLAQGKAFISLLNEQVGQNIIVGNQFHSETVGTTAIANVSDSCKIMCNLYERCVSEDNESKYVDITNQYTVNSAYSDVVSMYAYQNKATKEITLCIEVTPTQEIKAWSTLINSSSPYIQWRIMRTTDGFYMNPAALSIQNNKDFSPGNTYIFRETFAPASVLKNY